MSETKKIKTALVSVYHKEGLDEIITKLHEEGVEFLSTGGSPGCISPFPVVRFVESEAA